MASLYNAPSIPGTETASQVGNPWFLVGNQFLPRNFIDTIRWAKYIILQSPVVAETLRKYATYPITDFSIGTKNENLTERYRSLLKNLKMKEALMNIGFEYFTIGNSFVSVYLPIHRTLTCPSPGCRASFSAKKAHFLKFRQYAYSGTCPTCGATGTFIRTDVPSKSEEDINIVRWDPLSITIANNPITGEKEYYYKIPQSLKHRIIKGERLLVDSIPWGFIEAIKKNQEFKFDRGGIYHLMNVTTGASVEGTAIPPMLSLYSLVFYQATLRKANEAISLEYLNPLRVIFPQPQTQNSDPVVAMSMRNFTNNMKTAFLHHKNDPNHMVFAPTPVGYQVIGGEGKNLLVSQEIAQAEQSILLALGVSQELLSGTTNWNSTSIGLRMMSALLTNYTSRLEELIDWAMDKIASNIGLERADVNLVPFKLVDDEEIKQLLGELATAGKISMSTLFEEYGLNYKSELEKLVEEATMLAKNQIITDYETQQAQFMATRQTAKNFNNNEEYKTAVQKAQDVAEQLVGVDESIRRKFMNNLQITDYGQWLMVSKLISDYTRSAAAQQQSQEVADQTAQQQAAEGNINATASAPDNSQLQQNQQGQQ